jgi:hypothetical protein
MMVREPLERFVSAYFTVKNRVKIHTSDDVNTIKSIIKRAENETHAMWYSAPDCHWTHFAPQNHVIRRSNLRRVTLVLPMNPFDDVWNVVKLYCKISRNVPNLHLNTKEGVADSSVDNIIETLRKDDDFMHTFTQVYHDDILLWNYSRSNFMRSRLDVIVNNSTDLSTPIT